MGEKLADIGTIALGGAAFAIELNEPVTGRERLVHIQSDTLRIDMGEAEFIGHALTIIAAGQRLRASKNR